MKFGGIKILTLAPVDEIPKEAPAMEVSWVSKKAEFPKELKSDQFLR